MSYSETGPLNQISSGRRPRGVVKINGQNASFLSFTVDNKTHFSADTWKVELEAWSQPEGFGLDFFAQSMSTQVEILVGFLGDLDDVDALPQGLTSLIIGQIDDIDLELTNGNLMLSGRDFTARFIDTKTANKWPDHVSSQIVSDLCAQVGITPNVTATTTPAGEYYKSSYASLSRETPMWDIITFLAEQEGFDAYVTGTTLYFGPPQADTDANPFQITIYRDDNQIIASVLTLHLKRSETVAKDISVTVLSHSYAKGKGVKAVATRAGSGVAGSSASKAVSTSQNYTVRKPNISQEAAQQLANQLLLELTKFEKTADFTAEGDPFLNVRRKVALAGTQTSFDCSYYINHMTQSFDHRAAGYRMSVSLKNHPALSQTSAV